MGPVGAQYNMDLGTLLVAKGFISDRQLDEARNRQYLKGGYLSQHLIELGFISDSDMTNCLTCFYGYSYIVFKSYSIDESVRELVPLDVIQNFCLVPIEKNSDTLTVAMADPLNKGVIEALRQISKTEVVVFVSTRTEIIRAIEKTYMVPYMNAELDKYKHDQILRSNLVNEFVANGAYDGPNRRRYQRLFKEMPAEYFIHPNIFKTKIINISMNGVLFEAETPIPKGTDLYMKILLDNRELITAIVEVKRCDVKDIIDPQFGDEIKVYSEVGSFYNFMSNKNQDSLASFLRPRLQPA